MEPFRTGAPGSWGPGEVSSPHWGAVEGENDGPAQSRDMPVLQVSGSFQIVPVVLGASPHTECKSARGGPKSQ